MEKDAGIERLVESRTVLLSAFAGMCDEDFERAYGVSCAALKAQLAHLAAVDWEAARHIREVASAPEKSQEAKTSGTPANWFPFPEYVEADLLQRRGGRSTTEIVSEVVLSLQTVLAELRSLSASLPVEERVWKERMNTVPAPEVLSAASVAPLFDALLRSTEQHYEQIRSWQGA